MPRTSASPTLPTAIAHNPYLDAVERIAAEEHAAVLPICAEIEAEISGMEPDEKAIFLADMGLSESGLDRLIKECYALLGLISYLTAGVQEVRAWTITARHESAAGGRQNSFRLRARLHPGRSGCVRAT